MEIAGRRKSIWKKTGHGGVGWVLGGGFWVFLGVHFLYESKGGCALGWNVKRLWMRGETKKLTKEEA